jgi:hypothetical protein
MIYGKNTLLPEYVFKAYVGDYVDLKKMREVFERAVQIGTVADFLEERREAEYQKLLETVRKNSVDIEVEVAKAVSQTLTLKTPRKDVAKQQNIVEKPLVLELPKIALHGGNVNALMNWRVLRGLLVENVG